MFDNEVRVVERLIPDLVSVVRENFFSRRLVYSVKRDQTLLTPIDKKVEQIIISSLGREFPNDQILSEEMGGFPSWTKGRLWVIDPICGTSNFAFKIPFFTTNITLCLAGKPVVTFSIDYINDNYYWAVESRPGVYDKRGRIVGKLNQKIRVAVDLGYSLSAATKRQKTAIMQIISELFVEHGIKPYTYTSSLAFAYAAINRKFSGFMVMFTKPWDFISAAYLTEKNGGMVTDFDGRPWRCNSRHIVASTSQNFHQILLSVVKKQWRG